MSEFLLIACSAHKNRLLGEGPAKEMYAGTLFALAMLYAAENNLQVLILSAKYGFISPDTVIKRYDTKFTKAYSGPWPEGEGWYVGGSLYFANAPSRFKPLLPTDLKYGERTSYLKGLLINQPTSAICSPRPQKVGSKTWALYEFFRDGKHTQEEAYIMLSERFGENEKNAFNN